MKVVLANDKLCVNCVHYCQHYVKNEMYSSYMPCGFGHCVYPRTKVRRPETPACQHFQPKQSDPSLIL